MSSTPQPTPTQPDAEAAFNRSLSAVLSQDHKCLVKARANYGESWCKRGGVGAFMMLARKWDRLENAMENPVKVLKLAAKVVAQYDILTAIEWDQRAEGIIDDIRDLRRYLVLIEAKLIERGIIHQEVNKDAPHPAGYTLGEPNTTVEACAEDDTPPASALHPE